MVEATTLRQKILLLAELQSQLREAVRPHVEGRKFSEAARDLGVEWTELNRFWTKGRVAASGKSLRSMAMNSGHPELAEAIEEAAQGLSERIISLASFSPGTIELVFELKESWEAVADRFTAGEFSSLFQSSVEDVEGVLLGKKACVARLEKDEAFAALVRRKLRDPELAKATPQERERSAEASELTKSVAELEKRFPSNWAMCNALDVHKQSLMNACTGRAKPTVAKTISLKVSKLLAATAGKAEDPIAKAVETSGSAKAPADTYKLAGETSPLGVSYVLSPGSFQDLDIELGTQFVDFAKRQLETVRALLNIACQHKEAKVREEIRKKLGPEVEELHLAIQLFTAEHPNRLTPIIQAQRETWAARSGIGAGKKRGQ